MTMFMPKITVVAVMSMAAVLYPAVASIAADVPAAKQGANTDPAKRGTSPRTEAVAQAALADQVARQADRSKDVLVMISAARLLSQVSPRAVKVDMKSEGKPKAADAKGGATTVRDTTVNGLLARAKQYAGGRNDLNGLVDEVAKSPTRGRDDGPARIAQRIGDGVTDVYVVSFKANEPVMVAITGEGVTDLDLTVDDEGGNRVCSSTGAGDDESCRWTPRWTGNYRIRVRNLGNIYNEYRLWTN